MQTLLPVQLLTAVFFGIVVGFAIFVSTRTFYNSSEVVRAIHIAHKTQSSKMKKLLKATVEKESKTKGGGQRARPKLPGKRGRNK